MDKWINELELIKIWVDDKNYIYVINVLLHNLMIHHDYERFRKLIALERLTSPNTLFSHAVKLTFPKTKNRRHIILRILVSCWYLSDDGTPADRYSAITVTNLTDTEIKLQSTKLIVIPSIFKEGDTCVVVDPIKIVNVNISKPVFVKDFDECITIPFDVKLVDGGFEVTEL